MPKRTCPPNPPKGVPFKLDRNWRFTLCHDRNNMKVVDALGLAKPMSGRTCSYPGYFHDDAVVFPAGTVLVVSSFRHGGGDPEFDRVRMRVVTSPDRRIAPRRAGGLAQGPVRFWAKLADVVTISAPGFSGA